MALACNRMPDHSTIAAFVSSIDEEIEDIFTMVLMICNEEGLLGGTHFNIDGLKLSSNASKEWSGKFEDLKKKQQALRRKVKQIVKEHKKTDKKERGKVVTDKERFEKWKAWKDGTRSRQIKPVEKGDWQCRYCKFREVCFDAEGKPKEL